MSERSSNSARPVLVTAAIIRQNNLYLIARRRFDNSVEGGKWEFPGGKVEAFEHPEDCLVREVREELALDIQVEAFFDLSSHIYDLGNRSLHVVLLCYLCCLSGGALTLNDHSEAKWVEREQLADFEFAAADQRFVARLLRGP